MQLSRSRRSPRRHTSPSLLAPILVLSLAGGCLAPHEDEARPETGELLRGQLQDAWTGAAAEGEYPREPFWESFDDPILDALIVEALEHNHDLAASAERLRAAAARSVTARSARRPQLGVNGNYARQKNVFVGLPFPGTSGVLSNIFSQWSASLDLQWELDLWGKLAAGANAADAEVAATMADLAGARLSIAAQVARAWFTLREANEQVALARATTESFRESAGVVDARYQAGLNGALDLRLAESNVATSLAAQSSADRAEAVARRQIEILLGRFPSAELEAAGEFTALPAAVPAGVPADVLQRRPDLVAAERRMAAAEYAAKQARLDRWPTFALTTSIGRTTAEFDDLLDGDFSVWSFASALAAPLFDGGRRRARVRETLADLRAARSTFAATALQAFFEVENALDAERFLRERLGHLSDAVEASREATRLAESQYSEGLVNIEIVLESQRRQLTAESSFLAARRELFQSRVDLHMALGGSFLPSPEEMQAVSK